MKNLKSGYIPDIVAWMKALLPITMFKDIKMIINAGGANPIQGSTQCKESSQTFESWCDEDSCSVNS